MRDILAAKSFVTYESTNEVGLTEMAQEYLKLNAANANTKYWQTDMRMDNSLHTVAYCCNVSLGS